MVDKTEEIMKLVYWYVNKNYREIRNEDRLDLEQELITRIYKDWINGIYDANRSSFSTFVINRCSGYSKRFFLNNRLVKMPTKYSLNKFREENDLLNYYVDIFNEDACNEKFISVIDNYEFIDEGYFEDLVKELIKDLNDKEKKLVLELIKHKGNLSEVIKKEGYTITQQGLNIKKLKIRKKLEKKKNELLYKK